MELGRVGIWSVELRLADPGEISERAAELDELGWGTLWIPGLGGGDILADSERLLKATRTINVATKVLSIWKHDAEHIAAGHDRLRQAYDRRLLTGLGVSDPAAAHQAGRPFRPVADMNDYLDRLDHSPVPLPAGERVLAALGPKLVELARERTAGIHTFLVTPESTAATRQLLGPTSTLAPYQAVVLDQDRHRPHRRPRLPQPLHRHGALHPQPAPSGLHRSRPRSRRQRPPHRQPGRLG